MSPKNLWLAFAAFLVLLCLSAYGATYSPSYQDCKAPHTNAASDQKTAYTDNFIPISGGSIIDCESFFADQNGSAITAIATVLLTLVTCLLGYLAWDQGQTTRAQLRAYMYAEIADIKAFKPPRDVAVLIEWKNAGQTPAKEFETHGSVFVGQIPLPDDIDFEPGEPAEPEGIGRHGKPAAYPGTVSKSDWPLPPGEEIGPTEIAQLKSGERAFYAAGAACYRDIFGIRRTTRICRFIEPTCMKQLLEALEGNGSPPPMINWIAAHVMNDFT